MINIYEKLFAKLSEVAELNWIDMDKGQLDYYETRPSVQFPCALISVQLPKCDDIGAKKQNCQALITVRLAFDFTGNTSAATPAAERAKSLAYLNLCEAVYKKLQGWKDAGFNALSRQSYREEKRTDHYKVGYMPFTTSFIDLAAAEP